MFTYLQYIPSPRPDKHYGFRLWTLSTMFTFPPQQRSQSSGAVWKSMWPSWAPRPHQWLSLMVPSVDVKQHWTKHPHCRSQFVPNMSTRHPRTLSSTSSSSSAKVRAQQRLSESRVGRPAIPFPDMIVLTVSMDVSKQHELKTKRLSFFFFFFPPRYPFHPRVTKTKNKTKNRRTIQVVLPKVQVAGYI